MTIKAWITALAALFTLSACSAQWGVSYETGIPAEVSRSWRLADVIAVVPENLKVSHNNTYAPSGDIVWWGEPYGDRKAQVAQIFDEALTQGASDMRGSRPVTITATVSKFHAVTPSAIAYAPAAVHNISFTIQVFDASTAEPLTPPVEMDADLEAYVGAAAMAAAIQGEPQRVRIVNHLAAVTRGWLGFGPDQRRSFRSIGR